jgi:hypothetical protein
MLWAPVRKAHDDILHCLDKSTSSDEVCSLLTSEEYAPLRNELTRINSHLHQLTEIELATRYLNSRTQKDPFEGSWINRGFSALLEGQIDAWKALGLFAKRPPSQVVVVGSGALPQTQIYLHRQLKCNVLGLERDVVAAELSQAVLRKAGHPSLRVEQIDGTRFDYEGTSLVVVATLVQTKCLIAKAVASTAPKSVLSPRTPVGLHGMWREAVSLSKMARVGWKLMYTWEPPNSSVASLTMTHHRPLDR